VALGQAYLSYGSTTRAIDALKKGIAKGGVTDADEAQISLGIAYLRKGQKDRPSGVQGREGRVEVARSRRLWEIRTLQA
jgi:hypothetical protein